MRASERNDILLVLMKIKRFLLLLLRLWFSSIALPLSTSHSLFPSHSLFLSVAVVFQFFTLHAFFIFYCNRNRNNESSSSSLAASGCAGNRCVYVIFRITCAKSCADRAAALAPFSLLSALLVPLLLLPLCLPSSLVYGK